MAANSSTNHPVRFLGRQPFRRMPIAHLADVEAAEQLALERDLREAPTPLSGGMRKAQHKALEAQNSLRRRRVRPRVSAEILRTYGLFVADCPRCRHSMFFDEINFDDLSAIRCDRCKRPIW